jgi:peptide/nickel transport system permease protein
VRIVAVLGLTGWTGMARHLRAEILKLRQAEFVLAARVSGAGPLRVWRRHLLPNALAPVIVSAAFFAAHAILLESSVSFLGFGIQPPEPSWGSMLADAQESLTRGWWLALAPGLALFACVAGCNLLGEALRQALDPGWSTTRRGEPPDPCLSPAPAGSWDSAARARPAGGPETR